MPQMGCLLRVSLAALAASQLYAQTPPGSGASNPPQTSPYTIKVETRVVLVDVVVTDRKGESMPNLRREDFQVAEDGKPQNISAFEEHKYHASAPLDLPDLPANVYTNMRVVNPGDSARSANPK
jgi:hypothetical protein